MLQLPFAKRKKTRFPAWNLIKISFSNSQFLTKTVEIKTLQFRVSFDMLTLQSKSLLFFRKLSELKMFIFLLNIHFYKSIRYIHFFIRQTSLYLKINENEEKNIYNFVHIML